MTTPPVDRSLGDEAQLEGAVGLIVVGLALLGIFLHYALRIDGRSSESGNVEVTDPGALGPPDRLEIARNVLSRDARRGRIRRDISRTNRLSGLGDSGESVVTIRASKAICMQSSTLPPLWIYGKKGCPFSQRALEHHRETGRRVRYVDIADEPDRIPELLAYSRGERAVPVIVDGDQVTIGFDDGL